MCATSVRKQGGNMKLLNLNRRNIELLIMTKIATVFDLVRGRAGRRQQLLSRPQDQDLRHPEFRAADERGVECACVVIGGVAAGLSAAARARRLDPALEILVLEKGATISYGACGLPYFIEGRVRRSRTTDRLHARVFPPGAQHHRAHGRAGGCDPASAPRSATAGAGERVHYDRLVIATGARPVQAPAKPNEFTLHTLDDARRLKQFLSERQAAPRRRHRRRLHRPGSGGCPTAQWTGGGRLRAPSRTSSTATTPR